MKNTISTRQTFRDDFLELLLSIFYYNALCAFFFFFFFFFFLEASLQRTGCGTRILWLFVYPMLDFYKALQAAEIKTYILYFLSLNSIYCKTSRQ